MTASFKYFLLVGLMKIMIYLSKSYNEHNGDEMTMTGMSPQEVPGHSQRKHNVCILHDITPAVVTHFIFIYKKCHVLFVPQHRFKIFDVSISIFVFIFHSCASIHFAWDKVPGKSL